MSISQDGEDGENGEEGASLSVVRSDLHERSADLVDLEVENSTIILGGSGGGVFITVYHARVEYLVPNHALPSFEYGVTLVLPAPTANEAGAAVTAGTLKDLPLVPVSFKDWVLNPETFPADIAARGFTAEAKITLRARTEEGRELETSASVTVIFE